MKESYLILHSVYKCNYFNVVGFLHSHPSSGAAINPCEYKSILKRRLSVSKYTN